MASRRLTLGDLVYRLGFENEEQFVRELDRLMDRGEREAEKGGREAGQGWQRQFRATFSGAALGSFLGAALAQAFAQALDAARRFAKDSVREFAVYEQGLIQLKLAGETNLSAVEERIESLARSSRVFSRTDISLALGDLVKAGYDVETAFALVETGVLGAASEVNAATGEFGDLGSTAVQLGNILRALNYDTSQSGRVMDVMAQAAQDSNLDVSDLVEIISRVGPTAKLANLEIEDLAAMAAVLSNNGMDASLISTGLRSVLQSLINPTGDLKDELDELGVSLVTRDGEIRDINEVLDGLHELTQRGGAGLQTLTAATGSYGSTAASSLGQASEAVKEFRTDLENAEGAAQNLADTMRDSAAGAAADMEARLADARVELGEQLTPVLVSLYETVLPALIEQFGGLVAAIEALIDLKPMDVLGALDPRYADWESMTAGERARTVLGLDAFQGPRGEALDTPGQAEIEAQRRLVEELRAERDRLAAETNLPGWQDPFGVIGRRAQEQFREADRRLVEEEQRLAQLEWEAAQQATALAGARSDAADATDDQADANRDLADSNREVNRSVTERPRDPLIEDAGKVQRDLQRLRLGFDQGNLSMREYVEHVEAHVRRLDGLYSQATDPQQSLAILRARRAALDELARLDREATEEMDRVRAVNRGREAEELYPRTVTGANLRANVQARADAEAAELNQAWEETVKPALDRVAQERARAEEETYPRTITGSGLRARIRERARREAEALNEAWEEEVKPALDRIAEERARSEEEVYPRTVTGANLRARFRTTERDPAAERASLQQALRNLNLGSFAASQYVSIVDRARGEVVKLTEAQRSLGQATRDDVREALEEQITSIERLLPNIEEGGELYYELVAALQETRGALADLNAEVAANAMPDLTNESSVRAAARAAESEIANIQAQIAAGPDSALLAALEARLAFLQSLLSVLRQAMADFDAAADAEAEGKAIERQADALAERLVGIAEGFPRAIVQGIQTGDIGAALQNALGGAADFFLDSMLEAILGPIKEQLAATVTENLLAQQASGGTGGVLGALGPAGIALGGLALVASLFIGASQRRQQEAAASHRNVQRTVSGAPSITYELNAHVNVNSQADFKDPSFHARWRAETEALVIGLLQKVRTS